MGSAASTQSAVPTPVSAAHEASTQSESAAEKGDPLQLVARPSSMPLYRLPVQARRCDDTWLTRQTSCAALDNVTQLPRQHSTSEAGTGTGASGGSAPPACTAAAHGRPPCLLPAPQEAVAMPSVTAVRRHASDIAARPAQVPPAKPPADQQQAELPQAAHTEQPACIDLTLSDSDEERGPCTPPLQRQGSSTARAASASSFQTPVSLHMGAAERLRLARTQQQTGLAPGGGHVEAAAGCAAAAAGTPDCAASSCELPSLQPSKRRAVGDRPERQAAAVIGAGSTSSDADTGERCALDAAAHVRRPEPAEQTEPGLQLRCSRRVQKRAFELLSASRSPLIVAYPLGGHAEQHYIESLDMTADLAPALGISTAKLSSAHARDTAMGQDICRADSSSARLRP